MAYLGENLPIIILGAEAGGEFLPGRPPPRHDHGQVSNGQPLLMGSVLRMGNYTRDDDTTYDYSVNLLILGKLLYPKGIVVHLQKRCVCKNIRHFVKLPPLGFESAMKCKTRDYNPRRSVR